MKRKRETTAAGGGFWSKLTSFFATKPDQDENNQPVDDGHKEPGNGYAGDNQVTDNSKRRRVTQSEERTPPRSQSKAPQTPIDHIREAVKQGLTREEFEKYAAILQGAVREDENYQPAEGNFPRRPIPVHPTSNASPTNIIRAFTGNTPTRHAVAPIGSYTPAQPDNQQLLRGLRSPLFDTSASFDGGRKPTKGLTVRSQERPVRRTPARRRRVDSMQGIESISPSVATSITAKKILDTLNEFSSPLVDEVRRSAKKSSLAEKAKLQKRLARQLEDEDNTSEESVPTRSLTRQAVPTVPGKRKRSAAEDQSAPEGDLGTKAGKTSSASSFLLPSHPSTKGPRSAKKGASLTDHSDLVGFDKEDSQANGKSGLPTLRAQTVGTGNGKIRVSEFRGAESDGLDAGDDSFSATKSHPRTFKSGPYQPNGSEQLGEEEDGEEDQQIERGEEEHDEASLLPKKNKRARKAFAEDEGEEEMPSEVNKGATGAPFSSSIFGGFSAIKPSNKTSASVENAEEGPFSMKGTSFTAFGSGSGVSSSGIGADLGSPIPSFSTSDGKSTEQFKDLSKKQKKEGGESSSSSSSSSSIFSVSAESNANLLSFMNPSIVASSASGSSSGPSISSSSLFGATFPFASDASGSKKKNLEESSSETDDQKAPKEGASSDITASSSSSSSASVGEGLSTFAFKTPSVKFGSSSSADSKEKTPESSKTLGGTGLESPDTKKDKGASSSSEGDTSSASSGFKPQSFGIPALGTGGFGTDGSSLSFLSGATKVASTALSGSPETKDVSSAASLASLFPSSSASASLFSATAIDAGKKDPDTTPKKDSVSETAKSTQESTSSSSSTSSSLTASTSTLPIPGSSFSLFSASSSSALSSSSSPASTTSEDSKPSSSSSSSSSSTSAAPSATDFLKLSGFQPVGESGDGATKGLLSLPAFGQPSFGTKSDAAKPTDKAAGAKEDKEKATEAKSESTAADAKKPDTSSWATAPPFTIADWKSSAIVDFGAKTDSTKPTDQKDKSTLASSSSSASSAFTPSLTLASDKPKAAAASSFAYTFGSGASGSVSGGTTALGGVAAIGGDSAMEADNAAGAAAAAAASNGAFSFGGQTPSGSFGFGGGAGGADLSLSTPFGAPSASAGGMPAFTPSTVITPPSVSTPSGGMFVFGASSDNGPASSSSSSSMMFGGGPSASSGPSPFAASSPFGASPAVSNPSPFGAQPTSVFGSTPAAATPLSVFGSTPSADPFGGGGFGSNPAPNTFASPASVFGGGPTASSSGGFGGFGTQPQQQPSMGGGMAVFGGSDPSPFSGSFSSQPSPSQFGGFGAQPQQQQPSMGGGGGGGFSLGVAAPQDKNRRIVRAARRGRGK